MSNCYIALGGNLGTVQATFQQALALLDGTSGVKVVDSSRSYTTSPVGSHAGEQFLNAAAQLHTTLSPSELLIVLQSVETRLGRIRTRHWGPRTLDLDLLLYDQAIVSTPTLTVPHPHLWYRRFVLDPLVEIAPQQIHPRHGLTIAELHARLQSRPLPCVLLGGSSESSAKLRQELRQDSTVATDDIEWCDSTPTRAWLTFCLDQAPIPPGIAPSRCIPVWTFPTPPLETIRDALTAALDPARVAIL